jgi:hypothetical protein
MKNLFAGSQQTEFVQRWPDETNKERASRFARFSKFLWDFSFHKLSWWFCLTCSVFCWRWYCYLNVHGTRMMAKTQSVATGTAQKLKLGESAENSHGASMRIWNWFEPNDLTKGKAIFIKRSHQHAPHTHFCTQIERRSPANCSVIFVISSSDREF